MPLPASTAAGRVVPAAVQPGASVLPRRFTASAAASNFAGGPEPGGGGVPASVKTTSLFGFCIVPQQSTFVVERFGQFSKTLAWHFVLVPFVDRVAYAHSLKEIAMPIPGQNAITRDNVTFRSTVFCTCRLWTRLGLMGGECTLCTAQLAQTTMRSELGKITLDKTFEERVALT